jgi:hydrogenase nickel incorporation protein HypB
LVVLSVTEGEDKPVKYPVMFRKCNVAVINKIDLISYIDCKKEDVVQNILQVHPDMPIFELSATKEVGFDPWIEWLRNQIHQKRSTS